MADAPTSVSFEAIGTRCHLLVTDHACVADAVDLTQSHLDLLDQAVSRFRPDSEVSRLAARAEHGDTWAFASGTFAAYLRAALRAADLTDGLVDPTVGSAVVASGYDADLTVVQGRTARTYAAGSAAVPGWRRIGYDPQTSRVSVPQGALIDLGATAKAHAADTIARLLADRLPGGFLVNLGGDIAVSGRCPSTGWQIGVEAADGSIRQVVSSTGAALATSSTQLRTWTDGTTPRHHIIDPRTGLTARTPWAQVTCVAANALEANAASTAAIILADEAPNWLATKGIAARLDHIDGTVGTTPGWPEPTTEES